MPHVVKSGRTWEKQWTWKSRLLGLTVGCLSSEAILTLRIELVTLEEMHRHIPFADFAHEEDRYAVLERRMDHSSIRQTAKLSSGMLQNTKEPNDINALGAAGSATLMNASTSTTPLNKEKEEDFPFLSSHETNWVFQLFQLLVVLGLGVGNTYLNFEMIDVYENLINNLTAVDELLEMNDAGFDTATSPRLLNDEQLLFDRSLSFHHIDEDSMQGNESEVFYALTSCEFLKDTASVDVPDIAALKTFQRIVKASAWMNILLVFWVLLLTKFIVGYNLAFGDYHKVAAHCDSCADNAQSDEQIKATMNLPRTKRASEPGTLETKDERTLRTFLRSETIVFGLKQLVQDIPQATAALVYILVAIRSAPLSCDVTNSTADFGTAETPFVEVNLQAESAAFFQLFVITLSMGFHLGLGLFPRWVRQFQYRTIKQRKFPTSTSIRVFNIGAAVVGYAFGILAPVFLIFYSPLGETLLGVGTSGELLFLVVLIFSAVALASAMIVLCCMSGNKSCEQFCVCVVVLDTCSIGAGGLGCKSDLLTDFCC